MEKKIGTAGRFILMSVAIIFDSISLAFDFVPVVGAILDICLDFVGTITLIFFLYAFYDVKPVPIRRTKHILGVLFSAPATFLIKMIPFVGGFTPAWSLYMWGVFKNNEAVTADNAV